MPRVLGLDFETTGLNIDECEITEIGYVLWDVDTNTPLLMHDALISCSNGRLVSLAESITGISNKLLAEFGQDFIEEVHALEEVIFRHKPDYIVAHNGHTYDKPLILNRLDLCGINAPGIRNTPWLDTREDLPHPNEPDSRKLKHLATDHGFLNPFPHRAVFDVLTMLKVFSHYPFNDVVEYSKMPWRTVEAQVSFQDKDLARARKYTWDPTKKVWFKRLKEKDLQAELDACNFKTKVY